MTAPHIAVVGGGLAGLTAALHCADAGARVSLFETRARLGGATWSHVRDGLRHDNGQHVFLRCCHAYRGFLDRVGASDRVWLQPRLAIPVLSPERGTVWLARDRLPTPLHMARSLLGYRHLPLRARFRIGWAAAQLGRLDPDDPQLDEQTLGDWLVRHGQSQAAIDDFWDLVVRATLNLPPAEASLALAVKVFRTGLLDTNDGGDVGFALDPLEDVHAAPAAAALERLGVQIATKSPVHQISSTGTGVRLNVAGATLDVDRVILATTHRDVERLAPELAPESRAWRELGESPIVNLHVVYDRPVLQHAFAAGVGSPVQWVFDRTRGAGLESGQYLAVSLSAAEPYLGRSRRELREQFVPALAKLLPAAGAARVLRFFHTVEPAATFRQGPGARANRPGATTRLPRVFLAGAWTDTGWPATMEGAVRSGERAARAALDVQRRAQPAASAPAAG
ncbi:MAG: hydroxysqualene dehydroxylase HpnE, partial [Proteobacteria bacterium]|nr:hydroxysqualene dehydroxylase HpnE [Pseudomonadota bacterium]